MRGMLTLYTRTLRVWYMLSGLIGQVQSSHVFLFELDASSYFIARDLILLSTQLFTEKRGQPGNTDSAHGLIP